MNRAHAHTIDSLKFNNNNNNNSFEQEFILISNDEVEKVKTKTKKFFCYY